MAWMANNLYVKAADREAVVEALQELLLEPQQQTDREGIEDSPGPVMVSPALEGWLAVTGVGAWLADLSWVAAELSSRCAVLALSCEIVANSYRLRCSEQRDGRQGQLMQMPEQGWGAVSGELKAMPLYEDVEQRVYEFLTRHGVPLPLVTIGAEPLGCAGGDSLALGQASWLSPTDSGVQRREGELSVAPFDHPHAPVLPTHTSSDFGLMLFEERYVEGAPGEEQADRLLEIEEALLARAKQALPEAEISLTVSYHAGVHQERMDSLLRARNRHTLPREQRMERRPWWQFWRFFGRVK